MTKYIVTSLTAGQAGGHSNQSLLPLDLLKVAHHGSRMSTSDSWLRYWLPAEAAVSVGRNNSYGHPNPTVIDRLLAAGIAVRRTDMEGGIQYRISAKGVERRSKTHSKTKFDKN